MNFIDLAAQQRHIRSRIEARLAQVLDHGQFILGPEVRELEVALAQFSGVPHCVTCASGTDALQLALMALEIGPGDAVVVPAFTFAATAEAVCLAGATPILAEIRDATMTLDPARLSGCVSRARAEGLHPRAVIAVDLFGLPADYPAITAFAAEHGMAVICDAAQSWGGSVDGRRVGNFGDLTTTSFFPSKPLGCYGDGGAVLTADTDLAERLVSLRFHGRGRDKYDAVQVGLNSRLDTIQAAILLEKLAIFEREFPQRQRVAKAYRDALAGSLKTQEIPPGHVSAWAQYSLRARDRRQREAILAALSEAGIPHAIHYPRPLHLQRAYRDMPRDPRGLTLSEHVAQTIFSLPMHPYLSTAEAEEIASVVVGATRGDRVRA